MSDLDVNDINVNCHICGALELSPLVNYHTLPRVTSDCSIWPMGGKLAICKRCTCVQNPIDENWHTETAQIYSKYNMYHQSAGCEQAVFCGTQQPVQRSVKILKEAAPFLNFEATGELLDIGCANGELLRLFGTLAPGWKMLGFEIDDKCRQQVENIAGVEAFFSGSLDNIDRSFDLITLVHVLEHIPNPKIWLDNLHRLLKPDGKILIQVPNAKKNPFDLLIADHCSHFTLTNLIELVQQSGYKVITCSDNWVSRELSLLVTPANTALSETEFSNMAENNRSEQISHYSVETALQWLHEITKTRPRNSWYTRCWHDNRTS